MTRITGKTVDAGIDQDVITFQIRGVERGRITASDNTIGGGFTVGSSYLHATSVAASAASTESTADVRWVAGTSSAGSDVAINGGDNTKINISTTGWYMILVNVDWFPDVGTLPFAGVQLRKNGVYLSPFSFAYDAATEDIQVPIITPPISLTAGDFLSVHINVGAVATSWGVSAIDDAFQIVRMA